MPRLPNGSEPSPEPIDRLFLVTAGPHAAATLPTGSLGDVRVDGVAIVYRLFDVGFEIDLPRAADLLASSAPSRVRPLRGEAQAIQIANPPVAVILGTEPVQVPGASGDAEVSARLFDFGGVSLRISIPATAGMAWSEFSAFGNAVDAGIDLSPVFERHLRALLDRIAPSITRPAIAPFTEDYVVFRVSTPCDEAPTVRARAMPPRALVARCRPPPGATRTSCRSSSTSAVRSPRRSARAPAAPILVLHR